MLCVVYASCPAQICSVTVPLGCDFGCPNAFCPLLCSSEFGQLPSGSILFVSKSIDLRLDMKFFPLMKRSTFFLRKLDPLSLILSPPNALFQ